jgi:hypothetical protein
MGRGANKVQEFDFEDVLRVPLEGATTFKPLLVQWAEDMTFAMNELTGEGTDNKARRLLDSTEFRKAMMDRSFHDATHFADMIVYRAWREKGASSAYDFYRRILIPAGIETDLTYCLGRFSTSSTVHIFEDRKANISFCGMNSGKFSETLRRPLPRGSFKEGDGCAACQELLEKSSSNKTSDAIRSAEEGYDFMCEDKIEESRDHRDAISNLHAFMKEKEDAQMVNFLPQAQAYIYDALVETTARRTANILSNLPFRAQLDSLFSSLEESYENKDGKLLSTTLAELFFDQGAMVVLAESMEKEFLTKAIREATLDGAEESLLKARGRLIALVIAQDTISSELQQSVLEAVKGHNTPFGRAMLNVFQVKGIS